MEEKALDLLENIKNGIINEANFEDFDNDDIYMPYNNDEKYTENELNNEEENDFYPKLTKEGYFTIPDMKDLLNYAFESLTEIENFTIYNEYGKIEFDDFTDITFLNLDELVEISHGVIEVYPDATKKPKIGNKLNKSATLTFYQCRAWGNKRADEVNHKKIEEKLKNLARKQVS